MSSCFVFEFLDGCVFDGNVNSNVNQMASVKVSWLLQI